MRFGEAPLEVVVAEITGPEGRAIVNAAIIRR
jgi:hypothetical protein